MTLSENAVPEPSLRGRLLDQVLERVSGAPLWDGNRLRLLRDGPETYDEWLEEIGRAENWVHLDSYIFGDDRVGRCFAGALEEKAAAGVSVRVLYNWFGSISVPESFWRGLRGAGVEVRKVNPPKVKAPLRALARDHRKLLAVDGAYAAVGGACLEERWLNRHPGTGLPYHDVAVSLRGPAVADVERAFAGLWEQ